MLEKRYPPERLQVDRVRYDPVDKLVPLPNGSPVVEYLPQTRFYRTWMTTNYENYYKVPVIVAHPEHGQPAVLWSPLFRNDSPEFTSLFTGIKLSASGADKFGLALAELYASLYPDGTFHKDQSGSHVAFLLLRNDSPFRQLIVRVSEEDTLTEIACLPAAALENRPDKK